MVLIKNSSIENKKAKRRAHEMQHRQRKLYLDGMKGLASISVMLGHYIGIYKYAGERAAIQCGFMKFCTTFPFSAFMREEFWLYLFFVVSGYLVSASRVEGVVSALRKSAGRIVRFAIPITGAAAIVVLLGKTLGFHNQELRQLIENKWFFLSYREPVKWIDALLLYFILTCVYAWPSNLMSAFIGVERIILWITKNMMISIIGGWFCS